MPKPPWRSGVRPHWYKSPKGTLRSAKKRRMKEAGNVFEEDPLPLPSTGMIPVSSSSASKY